MAVMRGVRANEEIGVTVSGHEEVYAVANVTPHQTRRVLVSAQDYANPDFTAMKPKFYKTVETVIVNRYELTEEEWLAAGGSDGLDEFAPF